MINNINKEKFVRVQYTCHCAGKIKSESSGKRPNQNYYANECKCHVYMRFKKRGIGKEKYVITDLNLNHNHDEELNEKFYGYHPKNSKNSEVFQVIQKRLYSMTETEYAKNYQQFKLLASETGLLYFLNN